MPDWLDYNQQFSLWPGAGPDKYRTKLTSGEETLYKKWLKSTSRDTGVDYDPDDASYDMRGYWRDVVAGGRFQRMGKAQHFPDTYKTPYHRTFSRESKFATSFAPFWDGDTLKDAITGEPTGGYLEELEREKEE